MSKPAVIMRILSAALIPALFSCARFEESGLPGSASSMAHNQIMMVNSEQATFGHYRLISLMKINQDLDLFVAKRGMPDFLAETSNSRQHYYILYYLKQRQAYAARTSSHPGRLEFAGPYPVTEKEKKALRSLQGNQSSDLGRPKRTPAGMTSW